ncbi:MAG: Gfo/Idh/MocA family protein [Thermoguttaceae bacterium]
MSVSRRSFLLGSTLGAGLLSCYSGIQGQESPLTIAGFDQTATEMDSTTVWKPVSDRKIKMGLVGFGVCQFAAQFGLQDHPNVQVVAVSDLIPDRCNALAKVVRCRKTYPSLEEMVKDEEIEAVFVATDAPSHARHAIEVLKHGKHVASAVPAVWGTLEEADQLLEMVRTTGLKYMMFETSAFHDAVYAMRKIYQAGGFGKMIYTEGEYYHYFETPLDSFRGWRIGLPPQYYPTHSNAYYNCVTGGTFTEVSCLGNRSILEHFQPEKNVYANPFGTEVALFRTSEGGMSRMIVSWDTPGVGGETGRVCGQLGSFWSEYQGTSQGQAIVRPLNLRKPALPPGMNAGGHGGSHGYLANEFVTSILEKPKTAH